MENNRIRDTFIRVATKFSDIDKSCKCELDDENYVNTEMGIVKIIKENEGIHITGIADMLGVIGRRCVKKGICWDSKCLLFVWRKRKFKSYG